MILTFSQGTVKYKTIGGAPSGQQDFLIKVAADSKVELQAPLDDYYQAAFTHRDTNYLFTVREDVNVEAWGYESIAEQNAPFVIGDGSGANQDEFYLYIDINRASGLASYGWTKEAPVSGPVPPNATNPATRPDQQHWFDITTNTMQVWQAAPAAPYGQFVEVVRCFVAKYTFGSSFISMSINAPSFIGTTVGLPDGSYRAGSIIFDLNENVLKRTDTNNKNVFFTTEDIFASGLPTSSRTRIESFVIDGIAQSPLAAYDAVYFSDLNKISPLTPTFQDNSIIGIVEEAAGTANILLKVTTNGVINNANWNWQFVNQQIFVDKDNAGALVTVEAGYVPSPGQTPIAVAIDATTLLLRASELLLSEIGIDRFPELLDTPANYSGASQQLVRVNVLENGLEFGAELSNLDDVGTLVPAPGHVLYFGAGAPNEWESNPPGAVSGVQGWCLTLDELCATSPVAGNTLVYEGSPFAWNARDLVKTDITDFAHTHVKVDITDFAHTHVETDITDLQSYLLPADIGVTVAAFVHSHVEADITDLQAYLLPADIGVNVAAFVHTHALGDLSDVNFSGSPAPINGDVLTYTGTEWQALPAAGGGGASDTIVDTDADTSITVEAAADEDTIRFNTGNSIVGFGPLTDVIVVSSAELTVNMGTVSAGYTDGAPISLTSGSAAGPGQAYGAGGNITLTAGNGDGYDLGGNEGVGGGLIFLGGAGGYYSTSAGGNGGPITITAGAGTSVGDGGLVTITGGNGGNAGGYVGGVTISGGSTIDPSSSQQPRPVALKGGSTVGGAAIGGDITLTPGSGAAGGGSVKMVGATNATVAELRLNEASTNGSNFVALSAPLSVASDQTWILPDAGSTSSQMLGIDLGEFANVAALPSAATYPNCWALVIAALTPTAGRVVVRSDGTNWKYIADEGATVT